MSCCCVANCAVPLAPSAGLMNSCGFYHTELVRSLREQQARIQSFEVLSSSSSNATANINTLEGAVLTITLTIAGYQVRSSSADAATVRESTQL